MFARIKEIVKKGNVSKIQVKKDGEIVLNVPVNAGLVGVVIAPIAAVVAVVAAFGFKCTIEIIKDDGTIIDVSDAVTDAMGTVAEKSSSVARDVKEQSAVIYQKGKDKAGEAINKIKKAGEDIEDIIDETEEEIEKMRSEDVNTTALRIRTKKKTKNKKYRHGEAGYEHRSHNGKNHSTGKEQRIHISGIGNIRRTCKHLGLRSAGG